MEVYPDEALSFSYYLIIKISNFQNMKKTYIIPALNITTLAVENMMATSGPDVYSNKSAVEQYGMDVKGDLGSRSDYNVWDEDWSK